MSDGPQKRWLRLAWSGPNGETGHTAWTAAEAFGGSASQCGSYNAQNPGWHHWIEETDVEPIENRAEGKESHPILGRGMKKPA